MIEFQTGGFGSCVMVKDLTGNDLYGPKGARKKIDGSAVFNTACCCVGPQRGEPVCPCRMKSVKVVDGRYVETRDLGPADVFNIEDYKLGKVV